MDAVELSLPANVTVPKRPAEAGESAGSDAAAYYCKDMKPSVKLSEYNSVCRSKAADAELSMHDNLLLRSVKCDVDGRIHYAGDFVPKHEGKLFFNKSIKNTSGMSCSKRPRTDQPGSPIGTMGPVHLDGISRKIGPDLIRCTSSEKSRMIKQKRCQDGKKPDRKILKAGGRTKYDSLTSKLTNSDSIFSGGNVLGIYGIKSDLHDVTKNMKDLSLKELLDGSYKYSNLCPDKGKKVPHVSENVLLSVQKACAVLQSHVAKDCSGSRKSFTCLPSANSCLQKMPYCDTMYELIEESEPSSKGQDSCNSNLGNSNLHQPKDIQERLALPHVQDLDAVCLELNMSSLTLQSTRHRGLSRASLPPFRWSCSYNGVCKSNVDLGKLASTRNTCQGRWIKIGNNSISTGDDSSRFSELDLKMCYYNDEQSYQKKDDDIAQDVKSLNSYASLPFDGLTSVPHSTSVPEVCLSVKTISVEGIGALGPCSRLQHNLLGYQAKILDGQSNFNSKDDGSHGSWSAEAGLRCQGDESRLVNSHNDNGISRNGQPIGSMHGSSKSCHHHPCNADASGCHQRHSTTPERLKSDHSPGVLAAAAILCEMAGCSGGTRTRYHNTGRMKWPKEPMQQVMKARRPIPPVNKADAQFDASRHHDSVSGTGMPITRCKSTSEKNSSHMNSVTRRPFRWSSCGEGTSPSKSESVLVSGLRSLDGISSRPTNLMPSHIKAEGFDIQHRFGTPASIAVSLGGTQIKDWSRGRIKRL